MQITQNEENAVPNDGNTIRSNENDENNNSSSAGKTTKMGPNIMIMIPKNILIREVVSALFLCLLSSKSCFLSSYTSD